MALSKCFCLVDRCSIVGLFAVWSAGQGVLERPPVSKCKSQVTPSSLVLTGTKW